jgi:hypothetical protein
VKVTYLKVAVVVVCVLGSALVIFSTGRIPKSTSLFALAATLPVLLPLTSLVLTSRPGQTWICLILSASAAVGSFYQYSDIAARPDPFAIFTMWAYPIVNTGVVFVLLLIGMLLSTHFQIRRGEV